MFLILFRADHRRYVAETYGLSTGFKYLFIASFWGCYQVNV
ncbi:Uncharacterised protein [Shigella sonnei]|nr:hypothetical protein SB359474_4785 [Shigella boydii 3594-74]KDX02594.1 hypothetical protein AD27_5462 [Escherichia coli 2-177-06_S4_C3]CSG58476.1 Uncharacterised protein [Shigella sonnei]CSS26094.1 Uncharacterised protein [Shigella sonnei]